MGLLRNIKILLTRDLDERVEAFPVWNLEAENPTPRTTEPVKRQTVTRTLTGETVSVEPVVADPWGSAKKSRGAMNLLKLAVTVFMLVDVCAALFFISSSMVITAAALAVFIPNAIFLFILRGKL